MPFMCVTCRQIRFVWIYIGSPSLFCTTQTTRCSHTHSHTQSHVQVSVSLVECHTRNKACIKLNEILSYYCPCLLRNSSNMSNERSISRMIKINKTQHTLQHVHVFCMSYDFPHFKPNESAIIWLYLKLTWSIELVLHISHFCLNSKWCWGMWCLAVMLRCSVVSVLIVVGQTHTHSASNLHMS